MIANPFRKCLNISSWEKLYIFDIQPTIFEVLDTKKDDKLDDIEISDKKEHLSKELHLDMNLNRKDEQSEDKIDEDENK